MLRILNVKIEMLFVINQEVLPILSFLVDYVLTNLVGGLNKFFM